MTIQIVVPITALSSERSQVGGPITKVVGATSVIAPEDATSLEDRIRGAEQLHVGLQLPGVAAPQAQQHDLVLGANQRWQNVWPCGLGQHRHRHPTARPNSCPVRTSGTIKSVNVGVDQARVDCIREPAVFSGPNVLLLTDPFEGR